MKIKNKKELTKTKVRIRLDHLLNYENLVKVSKYKEEKDSDYKHIGKKGGIV